MARSISATSRRRSEMSTVTVTKDVAKVLKYFALMGDKKDICEWLEDMICDSFTKNEISELAKLSPGLAEMAKQRGQTARRPAK